MSQPQFSQNNNQIQLSNSSRNFSTPQNKPFLDQVLSVEQLRQLAKQLHEQSMMPGSVEYQSFPQVHTPLPPYYSTEQPLPLQQQSQHNPHQTWSQPYNNSGIIDVQHHTLPPTSAFTDSRNQIYINAHPINAYSAPSQAPSSFTETREEDAAAMQTGWAIALSVVISCCVVTWAAVILPSRNGEHHEPTQSNQPQNQEQVASAKKLLPTLKVGDHVGSFRVSSGFGYRIHPISGERQFHGGIDVAGPQGLVFHMPGAVGTSGKVVCRLPNETNGGGNVADIYSRDPRYSAYTKMQILHMEDGSCVPGENINAGIPIGRLGSTGNSTGPHGSFQVLMMQAKQVDDDKGGYKTIHVRTLVAPSATPVYELFGVKAPLS